MGGGEHEEIIWPLLECKLRKLREYAIYTPPVGYSTSNDLQDLIIRKLSSRDPVKDVDLPTHYYEKLGSEMVFPNMNTGVM